MNATVAIGDGTELISHPLRTAILGEVHARPLRPVAAPARILHFSFQTNAAKALADRENLVAFCLGRGLASPRPEDKQFRVSVGPAALRWEQHSEFTTYTWEMPSDPTGAPFFPSAASLASPMRLIPQPGPLLSAIDLDLRAQTNDQFMRIFDRASLAAAETAEGSALYATDFKIDADGFLHILILDRNMGSDQAGALVQHVLDIETYRTLALLGLPEAQRLAPAISLAERRLGDITERMRRSGGNDQQTLDELTGIAADVEADTAASLFRFGASRAYEEIVNQRLQMIGERAVAGIATWSSFLARRMAPAMRTCSATEARQANLSLRLSRAANLLRTRVDVELEQQNQKLLTSMNARTRLQLRLQTTVEGLSVAAITYYATGLFGYIAEAIHLGTHLNLETVYLKAAFVPVAALGIWLIVSRIRHQHMRERDDGNI